MERTTLIVGLIFSLSFAAWAQDSDVLFEAEVEPTEIDNTLADDEMLSDDEELMDRFMRPIVLDRPFDAEIDDPSMMPPPVPDEFGISRIAVIRGLDKITARVRDIEAPVGVPVMFESFELVVQTCSRRPPEETPETTAFLQVTEHRLDGTDERIFSGWMFASTPALNPVEHPVYDVWLIDCRTL